MPICGWNWNMKRTGTPSNGIGSKVIADTKKTIWPMNWLIKPSINYLTKRNSMRQVILDTETTGLRTEDGDRIIEIGCIELINRKFTGKRYHQYINPERSIDKEAIAIHGLTNPFLETKPVFAD